MESKLLRIAIRLLALGVVLSLSAAASAVTVIKVLSNRADLISGGDALIEVVPVPPTGTTVYAGATNVTSSFGVHGTRYMGLVTNLPVGVTTLTVTLPDSSGASIPIDNHPIEGPVFTGPHLQPWDCEATGFDLPPDANCNVPPKVVYMYAATTGGSYQTYDVNNPPATVATTTNDQGHVVRDIVRLETGAINRGLYAFAVLSDPALPSAPWDPQQGFNGKLYYPFGASCNTNYTQGSSPPNVMNATRLRQGYAVATTTLNELGHHCNPILSAETAMMTKEHIIETIGPLRFTLSTGGSGGSIGQLQVSNVYPGITNGLIPSLTFPDTWSTGIEVGDCFGLETYWPKALIPFTLDQRAAVDGHNPTGAHCAAWTGAYAPSGIPGHGCFSDSTLPTTSTPDPMRDYNGVTNREGCRATVNDIQVNVWGRRAKDGFARRPLDNVGVQYGLVALNLPVTIPPNPGKITMAQFLDLNAKIGGVDIDAVPQAARTRADAGTPLIAYRTGNIDDGRGLAQAAILDLSVSDSATQTVHTAHHAYALEARMAAVGAQDNHAIWHNAPGDVAFATMDAWLTAVEAAGGITQFGMDPVKVRANRPATAYDSCWSGSTQGPLSNCASQVWAAPRIMAGESIAHDNFKCQLKAINPADYAGAVPPPTAADLAALALIFPEGVCDFSKPAVDQVPSVPWLTYKNGPGGQPLGPVPASTPF